MVAKVLKGPVLVHVGERKPDDKKFETSEYLYAMPGTIVAPQKRGEIPTPENAARAILKKGRELGMFGSETKAKHLMEGTMPPAYTGPQHFNKLVGGQTGVAAANPTGDALMAISMVAQQMGVDIPTAVGLLSGTPQPSVPLDQGPQSTIPYAEGGQSMAGLLQMLLGAAGVTGPDLTLAQLAVMNSLGTVNPQALGVTDPSKFRSLIATGQGMPTLESRRQRFNEALAGFSMASPQSGEVPQIAS